MPRAMGPVAAPEFQVLGDGDPSTIWAEDAVAVCAALHALRQYRQDWLSPTNSTADRAGARC